MDFVTALRRERRYIYLSTALGVLALVLLLEVLHAVKWRALLCLVLAAGAITALILLVRRHRGQICRP